MLVQLLGVVKYGRDVVDFVAPLGKVHQQVVLVGPLVRSDVDPVVRLVRVAPPLVAASGTDVIGSLELEKTRIPVGCERRVIPDLCFLGWGR